MSSYQTRLVKVEALLQSSPGNASLTSLRDDLRKMIALEASKSKTEVSLTEKDSVSSFHVPLSVIPVISSHVDLPAQSITAPISLSKGDSRKLSTEGSSWEIIHSNEAAHMPVSNWQSTSSKVSLHAPLTISTSSGVARLGSRIEGQLSVSFAQAAEGSDTVSQPTSYVWYPGIVTAVASNGSVTVRFIGAPSGTTPTVTFTDPSYQLRALEPSPNPPSDNELLPGALLNAKYTIDGKWYEARVDELLSDSVRVTFTGYGNTEILPREYLCRMPQHSLLKTGVIHGQTSASVSLISRVTEGSGSASRSSAASGAAIGGGGGGGGGDEDAEPVGQYEGLTIPENLRLLPTDTETERLKKRKRVKSLKQAWKEKKEEDLGEKKATGWALFTKRQKL